MSVDVGTRLGSLEITALLGKGGMGEVYRARDTKLKRDVAIKILPDDFARDADRVARFRREAEVLASLSHQNIAGIHDLQHSGETQFLVLELVEGPTLAERIGQGSIPVDEVPPLAKQIADALEYAHEHAVMHRDLKPSNIKLKSEGTVKVLDFGLAKVLNEDARSPVTSNSPTLSLAATQAGVILGTAAYMSPEQAKGKEVDRRADIWSFGVVVYEMLTGKMAFSGDTVSETMAAVMLKEPDWDALPKNTPSRLRELMRRCLVKEPQNRLRDIGDARLAIEEMIAHPEADATEIELGLRLERQRGRRGLVSALVLVTLIALVLAVPTVMHFREAPPAALPEIRTEIVTPATSDPISFAVSPDGRQLVFVASGEGQPRLWLRPLDAAVAQPLAGTEGGRLPFWSPDSRSIGFFAAGKLKRIDTNGGSPQTLAEAAPGVGGTWSPDGVILFGVTNTNKPLFRVLASGGEATPVTKLVRPSQSGHRSPHFLPGGRQFLFYVAGTEEARGIYLGSLDSPEFKRLTPADSHGTFIPPGWLLFMRQATLVARRLDLALAKLQGDPVTVADSVGLDDTFTLGAFSVSAGGLVLYRTGAAAKSRLIWFDRMGKSLGAFNAGDENSVASPELSLDGRRVALRHTVQNNSDVYLLDSVGPTRFTFDPSDHRYPVWSPDGKWIAFSSNRKGVYDLYKKSSSGGGEVLLLESPLTKNLDDWSPDGRSILYNAEDPKSGRDLFVLPLDENGNPGKPIEFLKTNFQEHRGQFSPNGHWVAYVSDQSGQPDIWVRPFPGPGGEWQVSTGGGVQPRWRQDGKELYYISSDGTLMGVPVTIKAAVFERGTPTPLFQTKIAGGPEAYIRPQYDVAADGRFLINVTTEDAVTSPIMVLLNWKPPAK
jgi:Tol biopolymer transport system component